MGWVVVYDFAIVASDPVIDLVRDVIAKKWRITDKPTISFGSGQKVEYLSVEVHALPEGYFLTQDTYTEDLLRKWSMDECRPIGSLEDVAEDFEDEADPLCPRCAWLSAWLAALTGRHQDEA